MKTALETSGEDVKTTLETSGEDVKNTLETSGEDVNITLETSGEDVKITLGTSGEVLPIGETKPFRNMIQCQLHNVHGLSFPLVSSVVFTSYPLV